VAKKGGLTCWLLFFLDIIEDMEVLVAFESGLKELNLLLALNTLALCICARFLVTVCLIKFRHLVDALLVLHFDLYFELELMKHARYLWGCKGGICFDKIEVCVLLGLGNTVCIIPRDQSGARRSCTSRILIKGGDSGK
jgi:hypothetical protein